MMTSINLKRVMSMALKEKHHILRDPYTLAVAILIPVFIVFIFGLIINFDVRDVNVSFQDHDQTISSRRLLKSFSSSGYFVLNQEARYSEEAYTHFESGKSKASVYIPPDFEKKILSGQNAQVQILLDGTDNSIAGILMAYLAKLNEFVNSEGLSGKSYVHERFVFNPELKSSWFVVPGLSAIILSLISVLLTALTVSKEWENGSMELLLSTPVRPIEIIIGKMIPYLVIGLLALSLVMSIALIVFNIPFTGNILAFIFSSIVFLVSCLAQGILISVVAKNQQLSMQIAMLTGLLPSLLLSGFIFPIENMPPFFHYFTSILPARWYIEIGRSMFLKSAGFFDVFFPLIALVVLSLIVVFLAMKKFRPNLEDS